MTVTTVAAQGTAETDYELASFTVALSEVASTVPAAKARLQKKVEELEDNVAKLCEKLELEFVKNSVRKSSSVHEKHEYNRNSGENKFVGYEMTWTLTFQINDLEKVNDVYDALTSLKEVRVNSPTFDLKNRERLNKKALKKAWENVQARFEAECSVLGLETTDYEVGTWETNYSDSHRSERRIGPRAMMAYAEGAVAAAAPGGGGPRQLQIEVGLATVTVNLEVAYVRKASATGTVKATVVSPPANQPGSHSFGSSELV